MTDISLVVSGAAGQGVQTVEQLLVGILKMSGYHIFATKEYESRVRGGINSTELRISSHRVTAFLKRIDILIPLNKAAFAHLTKRINEKTLIITDPIYKDEEFFKKSKIDKANFIEIDFSKIAENVGGKIFSNVVAVGVLSGLFKADIKIAENYIKNRFLIKGEDMIKKNQNAFTEGYKIGISIFDKANFKFDVLTDPTIINEILVNGNEAIGLGAIAGGCNFISAYPMSPSTGVLQFIASNSKNFEIVVDQAEDEIAAINKAVAAWYTGARALVSTSGGGFALMTEGLSLAGIMESPLVIHIAQRPGPATGLPTRTAQEDLNLALYGGHGEFQRIIFAPGTIQQAFYLTQNAFNIADKYQIPVFVLTDQDFVDAYYNIPELDLTKITVDRAFIKTTKDYQRYKLTPSGISPRGIPGYGEGLVRADSDEHDENGHITEDMEYIRPEMVKKRVFKRFEQLKSIIEEPTLIGSPDFDFLIICWGSNYHVVKEAIEQNNNHHIAMMHFHQLYPLPLNLSEKIGRAEKVIILENNATGQFANVLKLYGNIEIPIQHQHRRYSGKPFSVEEVLDIFKMEGF